MQKERYARESKGFSYITWESITHFKPATGKFRYTYDKNYSKIEISEIN